MNRIEALLAAPSEETIGALLDDPEGVFWVDWREQDDAVVEYCEAVLKTGALTAEYVPAGNAPGKDLFLRFRDRRVRVPLTDSPADRHITLRALNEILAPDYAVRFVAASNGGDTLAFLPLPARKWADLEARFGAASVRAQFREIAEKPNLFTDPAA